jgi:hypothetical protein
MTTLRPDQLADGLRRQAAGGYAAEAAAELLIGQGTWLRRQDFVETLVEVDVGEDAHIFDIRHDRAGQTIGPDHYLAECTCGWTSEWFEDAVHAIDAAASHQEDPPALPVVWVDWPAVPRFLESAPCSSSEDQILRLAAELVSVDSGRPLGDLLVCLDDRNSRLVLDAIAHVLTGGRGWR